MRRLDWAPELATPKEVWFTSQQAKISLPAKSLPASPWQILFWKHFSVFFSYLHQMPEHQNKIKKFTHLTYDKRPLLIAATKTWLTPRELNAGNNVNDYTAPKKNPLKNKACQMVLHPSATLLSHPYILLKEIVLADHGESRLMSFIQKPFCWVLSNGCCRSNLRAQWQL